jgi:hypothetical protein
MQIRLKDKKMNNELTRFLNAEIECLKDELAHLQIKHDSVARSSINKVEVFIDKINNGVPLDTASDFLADTIDVIFKNGEMSGRIKELKKMIKKYERNLEILTKGESEKIN